MRTITRLVEQEFRATRNHFLAEGNECTQHIEKVELFRLPTVQRHHVAAKRGLQWRVAIKLVQHHISNRIALQFNHNAIAFAVRFVAQVGNAFNTLVAHQFGHFLDHRSLVHLIGNFGDDDSFAVATHWFNRYATAHDDRATTRGVSRIDASASENNTTGREIRTRDDLHHFFQLNGWIFNERYAAVDDFAKIMRRDVGRHTDRNTARTIDKQVRKACRQNHRFPLAAIIVILKINRILVDIRQKGFSDFF